MNTRGFDGQQEGERVLFEIRPHKTVRDISNLRVIALTILLLLIGSILGSFMLGVAIFLAIVILLAGLWWNKKLHDDTRAFITDRRIIRFERVSPMLITKRALFWNEVMKAKSYQPNLLLQKMNIGTLVVEPQVSTEENVVVPHIHYADDLANYIDKILFAFKNNPSDLGAIKPFVPKPRGQRD